MKILDSKSTAYIPLNNVFKISLGIIHRRKWQIFHSRKEYLVFDMYTV